MSKKILILGGNGFIGRHAVAALQAMAIGCLAVGTRKPSNRTDGIAELPFSFHAMTRPGCWFETAAEFDVVLNCVGILRPTGKASYDRVHHLAPKAIASACQASGTKFIHVSALSLAESDRSGFLTSKRRGEQAIFESGCDWNIVRPSLLDGDGGFGAAWLRGVSKMPIFASPLDAGGRIAALTATDLGKALAVLCAQDSTSFTTRQSRIFEFGGVDTYNFEDYIRGLRMRYTQRRILAVPIPGLVARMGAHVCDLFHFTPFSFGHWELLRKDNIPNPNRLPEVLGRPPQKVIEK